MTNQQPLSIYFLWHPDEEQIPIKSHIDYCFKKLKRDSMHPFSRALNIPVFLVTAAKNTLPQPINLTAQHNIIFVFICENILLQDHWGQYIEDLQQHQHCTIIPIALEAEALGFDHGLAGRNFIRAYEYQPNFFQQNLLISITHEIYRIALNPQYDPKSTDKTSAITLFLSHAKDGKQGVALAKKLKAFIDNTSMNKFFDTTDISPNFQFDKTIEDTIKKATLIAIHSDPYSSRYWCQKEIHCAKNNDRPMIAVDCLSEYEDRRFPYASNIPGVRLSVDNNPQIKADLEYQEYQISDADLYRVIICGLLETVRFFYAQQVLQQYKTEMPIEPVILARPPEVIDIIKHRYQPDPSTSTHQQHSDQNNRQHNRYTFLYPEPPIYSDELAIFEQLNIQAYTPLNCINPDLSNKKIGISISDLASQELIDIAQTPEHLKQLSQDLARHLLARNAILIYGGDLRPDGFTRFIFDEALALQTRTQTTNIHLINYLAWPLFTDNQWKKFKKHYYKVATIEKVEPASDVVDKIPDPTRYLAPTTIDNSYIWSRCLTKMRNKMINNCDIRICAGGKHAGYKGSMPGVLEEVLIAIQAKKPIYLLGGFGGVCQSLCELIETQQLPKKLTPQWQAANNQNYHDLCYRLQDNRLDYSSLITTITLNNLNNGLSEEDNRRLFKTPYADEAIQLILKATSCL